ncbi:MAG: hypothetical protein EOO60_07755 [Hymenobacter sp.]|nr:MAG: hypothetical protein EOO60_07755 [Hymenobacter sp.]
MIRNIHSIIILALITTQNLNPFGQSPAQSKSKHKTLVTAPYCGDINEYRETPQGGIANVICLTTGFDTHKDACWQYLAEYYYNVAPEPGVKIQHIYFVEVPKGTKPIRSLAELKNSPFKQKTFFKCTYSANTGDFTFKNYPYASK